MPEDPLVELLATLAADDTSVTDTIAPPPAAQTARLPLSGADEVRLLGTIGVGGMGIVHLGQQLTLAREVAVKTLRPEHANAVAAARLLSEARLLGGLEHPNIVPVHLLRADAHGNPMLVMKRVEGRTWSALRDELGLEANLRILVQVCNAVRFAHSRGVVHRDVKPENVMVGTYGEVYLLDWGIAARLDDGAPPGLAGTPAYMAPEMVSEHPALDPRTDVYLLGATLHEIITGHPPHQGETLPEVLDAARASAPPRYDDVPEELAAIARRALARDLAARFPDAAALRDAVESFLEHRQAIELARAARERLEVVRDAGQRADERALYDAFAECRFAFGQSLRLRPGDDEARRGLDEALATMARHELGRGDHLAARRLLDEMHVRSATLEVAVDEASAAARAAAERLQALERERDQSIGASHRGRVALISGLVAAIPGVMSVISGGDSDDAISHATNITILALLTTAFAAVMLIYRRRLSETATNRAMVRFGLIGPPIELLHAIIGAAAGWPVKLTIINEFAMLTASFSILAITFHRACTIAAVTYGGVFVASALDPALLFILGPAGHAAAFLSLYFVWTAEGARRGAT